MSYQVIARKWRPQTFADVLGQRHVTSTLQNAIRAGRVAHAYIFSGTRGVGKTTTARILAKALNCSHGPTPDPCNECDACREIAAGNSMDVLEIDAASNRGIDQVRELREMVRYAPTGGRYKVIILDEAHMLTTEASNALLKTLEEPPDKVVFVLATTDPEDLAETIRSRSQHFHFRALSFDEILEALAAIAQKEGLEVEPGALGVMARAADGSLRDAMSLLEQARAYCSATIREPQVRELLGVVAGEVLDELVSSIETRSAERALQVVHRLLAEGQNLQQFCREAIQHFRNLLIARTCGADSDLVAAPKEDRQRLAQSAAAFSEEDLTRFFQILLHTEDDLRHKPDPRLHLEMGVLRLVNAARLGPLEELLADISDRPVRSPAANQPPPARAAAPGVAAPKDIAPPPVAAPIKHATGTIAAPSATKASPVPAGTDPPPLPAPPSVVARVAYAFNGIEAAQIEAIKAAILSQQKFLGELIEHASRWELDGGEIRLFFPTERRGLAELLQSREPMEKLRTITSGVLGQALRVCVKLEAAPVLSSTVRAAQGARELRARFEQDPIVRAMLERFGGRISEVKRRDEE